MILCLSDCNILSFSSLLFSVFFCFVSFFWRKILKHAVFWRIGIYFCIVSKELSVGPIILNRCNGVTIHAELTPVAAEWCWAWDETPYSQLFSFFSCPSIRLKKKLLRALKFQKYIEVLVQNIYLHKCIVVVHIVTVNLPLLRHDDTQFYSWRKRFLWFISCNNS